MAFDLVPGSFWNFFPTQLPSLLSQDDDWQSLPVPSGISVSEDEKNVYVAAALPGVDEKNIDITFNKGILWIKGETREEETDKKRKYYRRATGSFSYRVAVPGEIDLAVEPEAVFKNGVMTVQFSKSPQSQPRKISVKSQK